MLTHLAEPKACARRPFIGQALMAISLFLGSPLVFSATPQDGGETQKWEVRNPQKTIRAVVSQSSEGSLFLKAYHKGSKVLGNSPLGVKTKEERFRDGLTFQKKNVRTQSRTYELVHGKQSTRSYNARIMTLMFESDSGSPFEIDVWTSSDGIGYRYRLPGNGKVKVLEEDSGLYIPGDPTGYVAKFAQNYEELWKQTPLTKMNGEYTFPALFRSRDQWILLTEAGVDKHYTASHLKTGGKNLLEVVFAPDHAVKGKPVVFPRTKSTPWRLAIIGDLSTVVESNLVLDVSPSCKLEDTSWIKPGRVAWSWWSDHDSPSDLKTQKKYVRYAAERGWEYVLVDAGWEAEWIPELVEYANERGVEILLWTHWTDIGSPEAMKEKLPQWKSWGIAGVKADFMNADAQWIQSKWYDNVMRETAEREMLIYFHGCTLPKGRRRRWPNNMTSEAVAGAEGGDHPMEHQLILPFTRNVVGPMDFTPVTFSMNPRSNTVGYQLALSVVYQSSLQHFADKVKAYAQRPLAERFLSAVPASWDETQLLEGDPGRIAVFARRKGKDWFVGGITAGEDQSVEIPFDFLPEDTTYVAEVIGSDNTGEKLVRKWYEVKREDTLSWDLQSNGGVVIHLTLPEKVKNEIQTERPEG